MARVPGTQGPRKQPVPLTYGGPSASWLDAPGFAVLSPPQDSLPASQAKVARGSGRGWWGPATLSLEPPSGAQVEGTATLQEAGVGELWREARGGEWRWDMGPRVACSHGPQGGRHSSEAPSPTSRWGLSPSTVASWGTGGQDANMNFGGHNSVLNTCSLQCLVIPKALLGPFAIIH